MDKLVSVVMPVYNASRFLSEAIDSVLSQTHSNLELILVNDCSTDNSLEIAERYALQDDRIRVIHSKENHGVAYTRNIGIAEAKGHYIALLDSDDVWLECKLEKQVALIERQGAQIVYCSYDFIDEKGKTIKKPFVVPTKASFASMLTKSVISCSTAMITADQLKKNPFREAFYHEDYLLWMELLQAGLKADGDKDVLARYRKVAGSRSDNKLNSAIQRWQIYRKALGLSYFCSAKSFTMYAINGIIKHFPK